MKLEVTRDVVNDLWPLCQSGDASADSRQVVVQFLAHDPQFAALLEQSDELRRVVPAVRLTPDAELRLLLDARKTARLKLLIIGGSIVLGVVALLAMFLPVALMFMRRGL